MQCFKIFLILAITYNSLAQGKVITHADSKMINKETLRAILLGEELGFNIYIHEGNSENLISEILDIDKYEFNRKWGVLVFTGRASAPIFLNSESDIVDAVSNDPMGIGIVTNIKNLKKSKLQMSL